MEKVHIEKNTVQETLVIPLFARKLCTERYPELFEDKKAIELMDKLDYDFLELEKKSESAMARFGALEAAMRQSDLASEVKEYLKEYPNAAVVNLGCGLDQTGESCDNGTCRIYNLDFPDVIAVRNQLLPQTDRIKNIAADLNDTAWFGQIDDTYGVVFFAAGVFYYFRREDALSLFAKMSERFGGGRLVFDAAGRKAVKMMVKSWIRQAGIKDVGAFFSVGNAAKELAPSVTGAKITARGYMLGYHDLKVKSVSGFFRFLSKIGDKLMKMQIVRMDFIGTAAEETK